MLLSQGQSCTPWLVGAARQNDVTPMIKQKDLIGVTQRKRLHARAYHGLAVACPEAALMIEDQNLAPGWTEEVDVALAPTGHRCATVKLEPLAHAVRDLSMPVQEEQSVSLTV